MVQVIASRVKWRLPQRCGSVYPGSSGGPWLYATPRRLGTDGAYHLSEAGTDLGGVGWSEPGG